jgi:hypothetical protein
VTTDIEMPSADFAPEPMRRDEMIAALRAVNPFNPTHVVVPIAVWTQLAPAYKKIQSAQTRQQRRAAWRDWRAVVRRVCQQIERGAFDAA